MKSHTETGIVRDGSPRIFKEHTKLVSRVWTGIHVVMEEDELTAYTALPDGSHKGTFAVPADWNFRLTQIVAKVVANLSDSIGEDAAAAAAVMIGENIRQGMPVEAAPKAPQPPPPPQPMADMFRDAFPQSTAERPPLTGALLEKAWQSVKVEKSMTTGAFARRIGVLPDTLTKALKREDRRRKSRAYDSIKDGKPEPESDMDAPKQLLKRVYTRKTPYIGKSTLGGYSHAEALYAVTELKLTYRQAVETLRRPGESAPADRGRQLAEMSAMRNAVHSECERQGIPVPDVPRFPREDGQPVQPHRIDPPGHHKKPGYVGVSVLPDMGGLNTMEQDHKAIRADMQIHSTMVRERLTRSEAINQIRENRAA